jgi:PAS domain S-box-containing protein
MTFTVYSFPTLMAILVNLCLGLYIFLKNPKDELNRAYICLMLILVTWGCGELLMRMTSSANTALHAEKLASVGYILLPGLLLRFVFLLTRRKQLLSKPLLFNAAVFFPAVCFLILSLSSSLMTSGVNRAPWGFTAELGPAFAGFGLYLVVLVSMACYLLLVTYLSSSSRRTKKQAQLVLFGLLIPFVGGSATDLFLPLLGYDVFEIAVFLTVCTGVFFYYAVVKYRLMVLDSALAAKTVLSTMPNSLVVVNPENRITMVNKSTLDLLGYQKSELLGKPIETILRQHKLLSLEPKEKHPDGGHLAAFLAKDNSSIPITLNVSVIKDGAGDVLGTVAVAEDLKKASTYLTVVTSLAETVDARDSSTAGHSRRVTNCVISFAGMLDYSPDQMNELRTAALLHDIGKVGIPDHVLLKAGPLDEQEWQQIRTHPLVAARILEPLPFLVGVIPIIRHHHERFDGCGYPAGLKCQEIPISARVLALADSFDAMMSARPYRAPLSSSRIFDELVRGRGTQFDPQLLDLFLAWFREHESKYLISKSTGFFQGLQDLAEEQIELYVSKLLQGDREEVQKRLIQVFKNISSNLFEELQKLTGSRICETVESNFNDFAKKNQSIFYLVKGRLEIARDMEIDLELLFTEYRKHFLMLRQDVADVIGVRLFDRILTDAMEKEGEAVRLLYTEYLIKNKVLPLYKAAYKGSG